MIARLNIDFAWASAITFHAVMAAFVRSANVALGTLSPRNERNEENFTNTSVEGTTLSGRSVSSLALTAELNRSYFFNLGSFVRGFRNVRLIGS